MPTEMRQLTQLEGLYLSKNKLSGHIPINLTQQTQLYRLKWFDYSQFGILLLKCSHKVNAATDEQLIIMSTLLPLSQMTPFTDNSSPQHNYACCVLHDVVKTLVAHSPPDRSEYLYNPASYISLVQCYILAVFYYSTNGNASFESGGWK